jgi:hypothetical protein
MIFMAANFCPFTTNHLELFSKVALTGELSFQFQVIFVSYSVGSLSSNWLKIFSRVGVALKFSL